MFNVFFLAYKFSITVIYFFHGQKNAIKTFHSIKFF